VALHYSHQQPERGNAKHQPKQTERNALCLPAAVGAQDRLSHAKLSLRKKEREKEQSFPFLSCPNKALSAFTLLMKMLTLLWHLAKTFSNWHITLYDPIQKLKVPCELQACVKRLF
jgi:hypothetical protein